MAEKLRVTHDLLAIFVSLEAIQHVFEPFGADILVLVSFELLCSKLHNVAGRVHDRNCRDETRNLCHYLIAEEVSVQVRDLADDCVVRQASFNRSYNVVDIFLLSADRSWSVHGGRKRSQVAQVLLHEAHAIGKRDACDDIKSVPLGTISLMLALLRSQPLTCSQSPRSTSVPKTPSSFSIKMAEHSSFMGSRSRSELIENAFATGRFTVLW